MNLCYLASNNNIMSRNQTPVRQLSTENNYPMFHKPVKGPADFPNYIPQT
jgi:hypothetical protein